MPKSRKVQNPRNAGRKPKDPDEIIVHVPTYVKRGEIKLFFNSGDMLHDRGRLGKLISEKWDEIKNIVLKDSLL